jgi:hypothetical protein
MNNCKNCNAPITGKYCSNCGKPAELRKINGQYILNEIGDFFSANKGFLYTIKKLLTTPGDAVREFIEIDRFRFVKPIAFLIITSLIYAIINQFFNIGASEFYDQSAIEEGSTTALIFDWMLIKYPGYSGIISGFFMAFWIKLFFKKSGYNIFEIFILICFVSGITTLFMSVVAIIQGLTGFKLVLSANYLGIIYFAWAIGQFFGRKKIGSYIKVLLSFLLGSVVLGFFIGIIGTLIDAFIL